MLIILEKNYHQNDKQELYRYLDRNNAGYKLKNLGDREIMTIESNAYLLDTRQIEDFDAVDRAVRLTDPFPLVSSSNPDKGERSIIEVGEVKIGRGSLTIIAGPCSVENEEQILTVVEKLKKAGADIIRGGAYKPRTSPYSFHGLEVEGLKILKEASDRFDIPVVTEILDVRDIEVVSNFADMLQIGMRNMRNYPLLKEAGKAGKPVLLKRATDATVEEWMLAAEYILNEGNDNVVLCERGILNPAAPLKIVLDLNSVLEVIRRSHLPVIVDPSHASAERSTVLHLARAAAAAGVDGLMIEVHPEPHRALSDGFQAIYPDTFENKVKELKYINKTVKDFSDSDEN